MVSILRMDTSILFVFLFSLLPAFPAELQVWQKVGPAYRAEIPALPVWFHCRNVIDAQLISGSEIQK